MSDNVKQAPPQANEYNPYYAPYIAHVADVDVVQAMQKDLARVQKTLGALTEADAGYRYAPDKWSIKEIVGHLIDAERIFTYRALRIGRGDATPMPGMQQDDYVAEGHFDDRTLADLLEEFAAVRRASVLLFTHMAESVWLRQGVASGYPFSVRALAHITAGHVRHHLAVLEARYLPMLKKTHA